MTPMRRVAIIGASGAIGNALAQAFAADSEVVAFARSPSAAVALNAQALDITDEQQIVHAAQSLASKPLDVLIIASGVLHHPNLEGTPEKTWQALTMANLQAVFAVDAFGPALVLKHFLPLLNKQTPAYAGVLSARVGSISDNRLGGWYSYRAAKAALNMIIKTSAVELKRRNAQATLVGLHPGTVASSLSAPFQARVAPERLFSPAQSAGFLREVLLARSPDDSGKIFAWDGCEIPP